MKHRRIVTIIISILITGNLLVGCSSSQPVSKNNVLTTQQKQEKIDTDKKIKEETEVKAKKEAELKLQLEAEQKAKLEVAQKTKLEAEAKAKEEEVKIQAEAQVKAQQEAVQKASEVEAQKISTTVYITKTGAKYHSAGCRYLSKSQIPISLNDAKRSYSPCSVCNPPQ